MTISAQIAMLAAEVASLEAKAEQSSAAASDALSYEREAYMWRGLYEASEQERLNLLGLIRGEQIP